MLPPGRTLLLFTDGMLAAGGRTADGLETVRRTAAEGPDPLEALCDHLLEVCPGGARRDDDVCLLALRMAPPAPCPNARYRQPVAATSNTATPATTR